MPAPPLIELVSATRSDKREFDSSSLLGKSLTRLSYNPTIVARLAYSNTDGLPTVYNRAIDARSPADVLVFIHDDVWIDDYFFGQRLMEGLQRFDMIGVAGNRRPRGNQKTWWSKGNSDEFDMPVLSGLVAHGNVTESVISPFGPAPAECELLDGVLLAVRRSVLKTRGVRFDERFAFHFYDQDFCMTARKAGLRLGTWPIAITHNSTGVAGTKSWNRSRALFREKWPE